MLMQAMARSIARLIPVIGIVLAACSSKQRPRPKAPPPTPVAPAKSEASAVRQERVQRLIAVPDEGPVRDAVLAAHRQTLEATLERFSEAQRAEFLATRPLAHVIWVSEAELALFALATTR